MKKHTRLFLLFLSFFIYGKTAGADSLVPVKTDTLSFVFEGRKLTGLLDMPGNKKPAGLVLLIPGSGPTNMVQGNGYYRRIRYFFAEYGLACYVWDKPGCGKSEGVFKGDMSIEESSREAIACIETLKQLKVPGAEKIGLWGLSRGGYVCPQIIASYPSINFWISVSGPDGDDTFGYLLEQNFLIEGKSKEETQLLMKEWYANLYTASHGSTFEENQEATRHLRSDSLYIALAQPSKPTKEGYVRFQEGFKTGESLPVNEKTGLQIYVPEFDKKLNKVGCQVLAIFGEKDSQVDWQKTKLLYENTIGKNPNAKLTIKTFPDCNHNIFKCSTGGLREKLEKIAFCDGYFGAMAQWLKENKLDQ